MSEAALRMDRMYGWQKHIYDFTRKPYLLGRDTLIENLMPPPGGSVLEIGCGTGRNLILAAKRWPNASFYGFDISHEMLEKAHRLVALAGLSQRIALKQADATSFDPLALFDKASFDRIFLSYTLSMIPDWTRTLEHAADFVAPAGALLIADFGDQRDLPMLFRRGLSRWLTLFHVTPRVELESILRGIAREKTLAADFVPLYRRYAFLAALRNPAAAA